MGDEDHRRPGLGLAAGEQAEHLGLHGDVERRGRLIGDDQPGPAGHRHGDHRPLAHAARELVRILAHPSLGIGDVDLAQQRHRAGRSLGRLDPAELHLALDHLPADRQHRVERGGRVLEDHADIVAAHQPQLLAAGRGHLDVAQPHAARNGGCRGQQAGGGKRGHALAGAALAHDAQDLARKDVEIDATDGGDPAAEDDGQVADGQDGVRQEEGLLFLKKKKQKDFYPFVLREEAARLRDERIEVFWFFFSKKNRYTKPSVRATSMLSMSGVNPPTFLLATISATSKVLVAMPKALSTIALLSWS